jgi:hypothetical protein
MFELMIDREIYGIDGMINRHDYRQSLMQNYLGKSQHYLTCFTRENLGLENFYAGTSFWWQSS